MEFSQLPSSFIPTDGLVVLQRCISAFPIAVGKDGKSEMAPIATLPEGAVLHAFGEGFDESTVRVRWAGQSYFVFRQDLRPVRKPNGKERTHLDVMRQGA